jgi:hypothetical protein
MTLVSPSSPRRAEQLPATADRARHEPGPQAQAQAQATGAGFAATQRAFAAHIRDPEGQPPPDDIEPRRMAIYRRLFFNNVSSLLRQGFPVLYRCLGQERWHRLMRQFLIDHRARTPLFPQLGQELVAFLSEGRGGEPHDPPFMLELAHYEWVEAALLFSDEEASPLLADPNGDLLSGIPVVSPLAWNLSYRFPVHAIGPDFQPREPGPEPTHLVVYRDRNDEVGFLKINQVTQRLLELLKHEQSKTGRDTLLSIADELRHPQPEQVVAFGRSLLDDLRDRQILLGTRRAEAH